MQKLTKCQLSLIKKSRQSVMTIDSNLSQNMKDKGIIIVCSNTKGDWEEQGITLLN